jgi:hypothetical protein
VLIFSHQQQQQSFLQSIMSSSCITLNNDGVFLMQQGCVEQAVAAFSKAMERLNDVFQHNQNLQICGGRDSYDSDSDDDCCSMMDEEPCASAFTVPINDSLCLKDMEASPGNMFTVYNYAFAVGGCDECDDECMTSAILFFNQGLAHHRLALSGRSRDSAASFKNALSLYKMGLGVFQTNTDLAADEQLFLVLLGLLTNMGHIFSHLFQVSDAKQCQEKLEMFLSMSSSLGIPDEETDFFYSALTFSNYYNGNVAPAA